MIFNEIVSNSIIRNCPLLQLFALSAGVMEMAYI
jgi:hypothetical protein